MSKRKFESLIRFCVSDSFDVDNSDEDKFSTWDEIEGELYKQNSEEYVYIEREKLDKILDSNSVIVNRNISLELETGEQIDLSEADEVSLSIS